MSIEEHDPTPSHVTSATSSFPLDEYVTLDDVSSTTSEEHMEDYPEPELPPPRKMKQKSKLKRGSTHVIYNSRNADGVCNFPPLSNIHIHDMRRMEEFSRNLKRLENMPEYIENVILIDSNGHKINGKDIDPNGKTWVISSGGLCFVAAVHALREISAKYTGIRNIVYHIGLNDELHKKQHICGESDKYMSELNTVTHNIFPNAAVKFITPVIGGRMSQQAINSLKADIVKYLPTCTVYTPPDMHFNFLKDGVHLNNSGVHALKLFITNTVLKKSKVFSATSGRKSYSATYSSVVSQKPLRASPKVKHESMRDHFYPYSRGQWYSPPSVSTGPYYPEIDPDLAATITSHVMELLLQRNAIQ